MSEVNKAVTKEQAKSLYDNLRGQLEATKENSIFIKPSEITNPATVSSNAASVINAAITKANANGMHFVVVPAGEYWLTETVYLKSDVILKGCGMDATTLKIADNCDIDAIRVSAPTNNSGIMDLSIDGNRIQNYSTYANGHHGNAINVWLHYGRIERVRTNWVYKHSLLLNYDTGDSDDGLGFEPEHQNDMGNLNKVLWCDFRDSLLQGVMWGWRTMDSWMCYTNIGSHAANLYLEGGTSRFIGNHFDGDGDNGAGPEYNVYCGDGCRAMVFEDNIFENTQKENIFFRQPSYSNQTMTITIANNIIRTCSKSQNEQYANIKISGYSSSVPATEIIISGNQILNPDTNANHGYAGIHLLYCENSKITGNTFFNVGDDEVLLDNTCENVLDDSKMSEEVSSLKTEINSKQDAPESAGTAGQVLTLDSNLDPVWQTPSGGGTVDDDFSDSSTNPVQNKVITNKVNALEGKVDGILPIKIDDTDFNICGKNLINPATCEDGKYVNQTNGNISTMTGEKVTDFVPVEGGVTYGINQWNNDHNYYIRYAFYTSAKAYISGAYANVQNDLSDVLTAPATAAYIRISTQTGKFPLMIAKSAVRPAFEPYGMYIDPDYIWSPEMQEYVDGYFDYSMVGRYDPNDAVTDKYVNPNTGAVSSTSGYFTTDYMEIREGETLYFFRKDTQASREAGFYAGYDKDKNFVSSSGGSNASSVAQAGAVRYIRASFLYQTAYYDRRPEGIFVVATNKPTFAPGTVTDPSINPKYDKRHDVFIYATDTEAQVIEKLVDAYNKGNSDVYFERSHYTFGTVLPNVKTLYALNSNEIPVGNNCHYYFNGATLEATIDLQELGSDFYCNLFGCQRFPSSYEMYDGILIATDTRYVVHDEASGYTATYRHVYRNMVMQYITDDSTDIYRKCIGGGTGKNGVIDIEGCKFITDGQEPDVSYHGNSTDAAGAEFNVNIRNSWFSKTFAANELSTNQTARLFFNGNSTASAIISYARWDVTSFLNEVRS